MTDDPFRSQRPDPVCLTCAHNLGFEARGEMILHAWGGWKCGAHVESRTPGDYNPVTGFVREEQVTYRRCIEVNGDGKCTKYERKVDPEPGPEGAPSDDGIGPAHLVAAVLAAILAFVAWEIWS